MIKFRGVVEADRWADAHDLGIHTLPGIPMENDVLELGGHHYVIKARVWVANQEYLNLTLRSLK